MSELSKIETGDHSFILLVGNDICKEDVSVVEDFILKHVKGETLGEIKSPPKKPQEMLC